MAITQRVVLTGARGYIGKRFEELYSVDQYSKFRIETFPGNLLNRHEFSKFLRNGSLVTCVIHLAGKTLGTNDELYSNNFLASNALISACIENGVKKVIYTSTSAVYGDIYKKPADENYLKKPISIYGLSKLKAENLLLDANIDSSLNFLIFRIPSVFSSAGGQGVISRIEVDSRLKSQVTIFGSGNQIRQFIHLDDVCSAIFQGLKDDHNGIYNLGSGIVLSVNEIVNEFSKFRNFSINYKDNDNPHGYLVLDWQKIHTDFGFTPQWNEFNYSDLYAC